MAMHQLRLPWEAMACLEHSYARLLLQRHCAEAGEELLLAQMEERLMVEASSMVRCLIAIRAFRLVEGQLMATVHGAALDWAWQARQIVVATRRSIVETLLMGWSRITPTLSLASSTLCRLQRASMPLLEDVDVDAVAVVLVEEVDYEDVVASKTVSEGRNSQDRRLFP
jgi:hypothetical protein